MYTRHKAQAAGISTSTGKGALSQNALSYLTSLKASTEALKKQNPKSVEKKATKVVEDSNDLSPSTSLLELSKPRERRNSLSQMIKGLRQRVRSDDDDSNLSRSFGKINEGREDEESNFSFEENVILEMSSLSEDESVDTVLNSSLRTVSKASSINFPSTVERKDRKSLNDLRELRNSIDQTLFKTPVGNINKKILQRTKAEEEVQAITEKDTDMSRNQIVRKSVFKPAVESGSSDAESIDFEEDIAREESKDKKRRLSGASSVTGTSVDFNKEEQSSSRSSSSTTSSSSTSSTETSSTSTSSSSDDSRVSSKVSTPTPTPAKSKFRQRADSESSEVSEATLKQPQSRSSSSSSNNEDQSKRRPEQLIRHVSFGDLELDSVEGGSRRPSASEEVIQSNAPPSQSMDIYQTTVQSSTYSDITEVPNNRDADNHDVYQNSTVVQTVSPSSPSAKEPHEYARNDRSLIHQTAAEYDELSELEDVVEAAIMESLSELSSIRSPKDLEELKEIIDTSTPPKAVLANEPPEVGTSSMKSPPEHRTDGTARRKELRTSSQDSPTTVKLTAGNRPPKDQNVPKSEQITQYPGSTIVNRPIPSTRRRSSSKSTTENEREFPDDYSRRDISVPSKYHEHPRLSKKPPAPNIMRIERPCRKSRSSLYDGNYQSPIRHRSYHTSEVTNQRTPTRIHPREKLYESSRPSSGTRRRAHSQTYSSTRSHSDGYSSGARSTEYKERRTSPRKEERRRYRTEGLRNRSPSSSAYNSDSSSRRSVDSSYYSDEHRTGDPHLHNSRKHNGRRRTRSKSEYPTIPGYHCPCCKYKTTHSPAFQLDSNAVAHNLIREVVKSHLTLLNEHTRREWETLQAWDRALEEARLGVDKGTCDKLGQLIEQRSAVKRSTFDKLIHF